MTIRKFNSTRQMVVGLVVLTLLLTACTDTDLQRLAKAYDVTAQAMTVVQTAVVNANAATPPLINNATATKIMQVTLKVNLANKDAITATRAIAKLDNPTKAKVSEILKPSIEAINAAVVDQNILSIQDVKTRDAIHAALTAAQTEFTTVQLILATR